MNVMRHEFDWLTAVDLLHIPHEGEADKHECLSKITEEMFTGALPTCHQS